MNILRNLKRNSKKINLEECRLFNYSYFNIFLIIFKFICINNKKTFNIKRKKNSQIK